MQEFRLPPSYRDLADMIRRDIDNGRWAYGEKLPGSKELAQEYGVNVTTIQRAMRLLAETGDIVSRQGLGRFVTRR